ncbi:DUF4259 domain-containing protein [Streptomyces sp. NPDC058467]
MEALIAGAVGCPTAWQPTAWQPTATGRAVAGLASRPGLPRSPEGAEAVAAAALVAAQCPGGEPIGTSCRPDEGLPTFADDLRTLAAEVLGRVVAEASELAELWDETPDGPKWRQSISRICAVLALEPEHQGDPLFDL